MRADRRDPTIAALRRFKPHSFVVNVRGGEQRKVPLSTKQNRWELLSDTLSILPWETIEAFDTSGNLLGAVERDGDELDEGLGDDVTDVGAMSRLILDAVRVTMQETRRMFADTIQGFGELTKGMLESMHVMRESYSMAMKVQASAAALEGDEGNDAVAKMLQMAMQLQMGSKLAQAALPSKPKPAPTKPTKPEPNGAK